MGKLFAPHPSGCVRPPPAVPTICSPASPSASLSPPTFPAPSLRDFQAGAFQLQEATGLASLAVHDCTKLTDTALRTLLALEGPAASGERGQQW